MEPLASLAEVEIRPVAMRPPASDCTADDWAPAGLDPSMIIADTLIRFQYQSGGSRDGGTVWSDSVPGPTIRFDVGEHQVVEAPAGIIARLELGASVTLAAGRLELCELGGDDDLDDGASPVAAVGLGGDSAGLDVPLPMEPGRWLLVVRAVWQTDCAAGDG